VVRVPAAGRQTPERIRRRSYKRTSNLKLHGTDPVVLDNGQEDYLVSQTPNIGPLVRRYLQQFAVPELRQKTRSFKNLSFRRMDAAANEEAVLDVLTVGIPGLQL